MLIKLNFEMLYFQIVGKITTFLSFKFLITSRFFHFVNYT